MSKMIIVIADADENYLSPLEIKFVDEMSDIADIVTITDINYFEEYFNTPRKIDILIINKSFYSESLIKHDIDKMFILNEDEDTCRDNEIYKYTSVKDIYDAVISNVSLEEKLVQEKKHTEIIMVYSPVGGVGTTALSVAFAKALAGKHKRVLHISAENIQSIAAYVEPRNTMSKVLEKAISTKAFDAAEKVNAEVFVEDGVFYVPPAKQAMTVLGIRNEHYIHLLEKLKQMNTYDYIVLDTDSDLNSEVCSLMVLADKVSIIAAQDKVSVKKIDIFLENIDCSNMDKFMFLCNKYRSNIDNNLTNSTMKNNCIVKQYISYFDDMRVDEIVRSDALQNFVYGLM